jgi:2-phosphosulfolactate phosphatase
MFYDQTQFAIRCEWGERGAAVLAATSDLVIIVDVLSFSTCVDIATARGAIIFPHRWKDTSTDSFAASHNAIVAAKRGSPGQFSLSPASLETIPPSTRLVLPSPNGATLTFSTGATPTVCACLRNARAVADYASRHARNIAVIPAGERWEDGSLRPCVEDLVGAGAIIQHMQGDLSPEAAAAAAVFDAAKSDLKNRIMNCASGRELVERGFERDVLLASALDRSNAVPIFKGAAYANVDSV